MSASRTFLSKALHEGGGRLALVIGNGIHRYDARTVGNDWNAMVQSLAQQHGLKDATKATELALTELFDVIDLVIPAGGKPTILQEQFCKGMSEWKPAAHHCWITQWAVSKNTPILTTNFDHVLANSVRAELHSLFERRGSLKAPTDYYPWEKYFGLQLLADPCDGFGIWHINGLIKHIRSIRLGLSHYMGSVSRARPWLHGDKCTRLFSSRDVPEWRGRNTWLHILFNMPLLIFGLQLGGQEVFLRWLLIERAKFFRQFPERAKPAWYVHTSSENSPEDISKYFFLKSTGIQPIEVDNYDSIYGAEIWR